MKDMIAYCGLDCEKCDAYLATIHDDQGIVVWTAKSVMLILQQFMMTRLCGKKLPNYGLN